MPQDIPIEASETLAFTPASLAEIPGAPKFTLRTPTHRDKRFHRRLVTEEGVSGHGPDAIRAEVLNGLKLLWSPEAFDEHSPIIRAYWDARDDHELQLKDDSKLLWSYDADVEEGVRDLTRKVAEAHAPLRRMLADNDDFQTMVAPLLVAVVVKSWSGLAAAAQIDRGYLTVDCVENMAEALLAYEKANRAAYKLAPGTAWLELFVGCSRRMRLDEDEGNDSASPSPCETTPLASTETTPAKDGKSPARARSRKTRVN